jgi:hypothetical protein
MSIENSTQSRLLRISNIHSTNVTDTSSNFTVNLNRMTETNQIVRAVCKSVSFPNTAYNIRTATTNTGQPPNNVFLYEVAGVPYSYELVEAGFYKIQKIIDLVKVAIQTKLSVSNPSDTLLMVVGQFSKKIEYVTTLGGGNVILGHTSGPLSGTTGSLNIALGAIAVSPIIDLVVYKSPVLPTLAGLTRVFVHSTTIAEGNLVDGDVENHDIICEVPINVSFGGMAIYESSDDELDSINYGSVRNFDQINITLRDLETNIIDLNGGITEVILKLYYF